MNITYRRLNSTDITGVAAIFNENFPAQYQVNETLLQNKLFSTNDLLKEGSFIAFNGKNPVGFIAVKLSDGAISDYDSTAFISLFAVKSDFQNKGIGTKLFSLAEEKIKTFSCKTLLVSQDMNNLFAGIPNPTQSSAAFFKNRGFILNSKEHWDLVNDLSTYSLDSEKSTVNMTDEYKTVAAEKKDVPALEQFMKTEFPGRWTYEVSLCYNNDTLHHILLLRKGNAIKGFCRIRHGSDTNGNEFYLGNDCGALGPIGIAKDIRKLGLGKRILFDALCVLKAEGAHKVNIDWTELKDFYGLFDFKPWRTYLGAYKTYL